MNVNKSWVAGRINDCRTERHGMVERVASCVKSDLLTLQKLNTILYEATDSLRETVLCQASRLSDDVFSKEPPP